MNFFSALYSNPLLLAALVAALLASLVSGIVGSYVVVKRIVFLGGSISHAVLGGIGVSLWLERRMGLFFLSPLYGALAAALLSALLLGWMRLRYRQREDSLIALIWSVGMAIGVLFMAMTPGYNVELTNFIVGNLLWVAPSDLWLLASLDLFILCSVPLLHKKMVAVCFDEDEALLRGLWVSGLYLFLLLLTALSIVLLTQVVGVILVMTMLTIPPAIANLFTKSLSNMMALASAISALCSLAGMALAYEWDLPTGATIALLAGLTYLLALLLPRR